MKDNKACNCGKPSLCHFEWAFATEKDLYVCGECARKIVETKAIEIAREHAFSYANATCVSDPGMGVDAYAVNAFKEPAFIKFFMHIWQEEFSKELIRLGKVKSFRQ